MSEPTPKPTEIEVRCPECDYRLAGAVSDRCPWCGWKIDVNVLTALAEEKPGLRRVGFMIAAAVLGIGSLLGVAALVPRGPRLSLFDGLTVLAVFVAGVGHLGLALLALLNKQHWPLRQGEAANVLRFVGWLSIVTGVLGASNALHVSSAARGVQGIVVSGTLEFFLRSVFFTLPGWTLLGLRLVSFRHGYDASASRTPTTDTRPGALPGWAPFMVEVFGRFVRNQLTQCWCDEPRPTTPAIEAAIARTWEAEHALAKVTGGTLYNGELARLVRVETVSNRPSPGAEEVVESLRLVLGPTCYCDFFGTNLHNTAIVLQANPAAFANPLGISATVTTHDGFLAFGRRSRRVAYHGGFLHPFGGMLESADRRADGSYDVFGSALRELREELGLEVQEVAEIMISGLVRDRSLYQPELLFEVTVTLTREALAARFDPSLGEGEHTHIEFVYDDPEAVIQFLDSATPVTPITHAAILLHGRHDWGATWYEQACYSLYGELPPTSGAIE